jgi:hypothetical protein
MCPRLAAEALRYGRTAACTWAAFSKLSEEDLDSVKGRFDELRHRVVKAYGYAEQRAARSTSAR